MAPAQQPEPPGSDEEAANRLYTYLLGHRSTRSTGTNIDRAKLASETGIVDEQQLTCAARILQDRQPQRFFFSFTQEEPGCNQQN